MGIINFNEVDEEIAEEIKPSSNLIDFSTIEEISPDALKEDRLFQPDPNAPPLASDLPELITQPSVITDAGATPMGAASVAAGAALTNEQHRLKSILQEHVPNLDFREDEAGDIIAIAPDGKEFSLNRQGITAQDMVPFATDMVIDILGPGKIKVAGKIGKTAIGVAADVVTDLLKQQATDELGGGERDLVQTGITGALSTIIRGTGGFLSTAGDDVVPTAEQVEAAGKRFGIDVLPTDINPPKTGFGKFTQALREAVPIIGSGGRRAAQSDDIEKALIQLKDEFGIVSADDPLGEIVIASLSRSKSNKLTHAASLRDAALKDIDPDIPVDVKGAVDSVDKALGDEAFLREMADPSTIDSLNKVKATLAPDGNLDTVSIDLAIQARSRLISQIQSLSAQAKSATPGNAPTELARLQSIKKAFDDVIEGHIETVQGKEALNMWKAGNKEFADVLTETRKTELRRLLDKGEFTPEVITPVLRGGKRSELVRLNKNLTARGRGAVRQSIISDALTKAGAFTGDMDLKKFSAAMKSYDPAIRVFFDGADRKALEGLTSLVELTKKTRQAQQTGPALLNTRGAISAVSSVGSLFLLAQGLPGVASVAAFTAYAKAMESTLVKKALIGIAKSKEGSAAWLGYLRTLDTAFRSATQSVVRQNMERDLEETEE